MWNKFSTAFKNPSRTSIEDNEPPSLVKKVKSSLHLHNNGEHAASHDVRHTHTRSL